MASVSGADTPYAAGMQQLGACDDDGHLVSRCNSVKTRADCVLERSGEVDGSDAWRACSFPSSTAHISTMQQQCLANTALGDTYTHGPIVTHTKMSTWSKVAETYRYPLIYRTCALVNTHSSSALASQQLATTLSLACFGENGVAFDRAVSMYGPVVKREPMSKGSVKARTVEHQGSMIEPSHPGDRT